MPRIEAVFVGTELLEGRVNTHAAELAALLAAEGWGLARESSVADEVEEISTAISEALARAEAVLVFGGLGPTFDDLSREGAAQALETRLVFKPALLQDIRRKFSAKGLPMAPENRRQAFVLEGGRALRNRLGSAPGQLVRTDGGRLLALLPGPLHEMRPILLAEVLPALRERFGRGRFFRAEFHLSGILESIVDHRLRPLLKKLPKLKATILSGQGLVDFYASSEDERSVESFARQARKLLRENLFAEGGVSLAQALGLRLKSKKQTFALAESCTGGLVAKLATDAAGSSDYFLGGVVAYSNELKKSALGVSAETLKKHGAVSEACAKELALGARERLGADWGVSLTGIAGPGGALPGKPVGLVYIGVAGKNKTEVRRFDFSGNRAEIRMKAANAALFSLWEKN